jgi:bZIP transcription factor
MISNSTPHSLASMEAAFLSGVQEKDVNAASGPNATGHKRPFSDVSDADGDNDDDDDDDDEEDDTNPNKRQLSAEDKKMKRIMANRRSARESRERRKSLLSNLEASVEILSKENASLVRENGELRKQLTRLMPPSNLGMFNQQQMQPQGLAALYGNQMRPHAQQNAQLMQLQKEQQILEAMRRRQGF